MTIRLSYPLVCLTGFLALLKAIGINITWLWVFSPLWLPFAFMGGIICLFCAIFIIVLVISLIAFAFDEYGKR